MDLLTAVKSKVSDYSEKNKQKSQQQNKEAIYLLKIYSEKHDIQYLIKAIDIYSELVKYYTDFIPAYLSLAYISWEMGNHNEAIGLIKKAIEIEPFNTAAQKMLNEYTVEMKNKSIARYKTNKNIDSNFSENLKEKVIKNKNNKKGLFSTIMSMFATSPNKKIVSKNKKEITKNLKQNKADDFSEMLSQTSKIMQAKNNKIVTSERSTIHFRKEK